MLTPGTLLQNRYEIVRLIGRGGMGAVYEARDQRLGVRVALKQTLVMEESLRRAFEREARILAELHHPILPGVSDHFVEGEGQYLVMRYIPGEDLAGLMKEQGGGFPVTQVLGWAEQLLDGLEYLHSQEPPVIHRDIKPQNLKATARGAIILLDFGLAKGGHLEGGQGTGMYSIFGYTPHYAPLEQIQGSGTEARSDLYALGATLYHLLTGAEPPDALARASAVLGGQPDPLRPAHEINPQVPPELSQVLTKAMAPSPVQRYASAMAMQEALRASGSPASSKPTRVTAPEGEDFPTATLPGVAAVPKDATLSLPRPAISTPGDTVYQPGDLPLSGTTPAPVVETPPPPPESRRSFPFLLPLGLIVMAVALGVMLLNSFGQDTNADDEATPTAGAISVASTELPDFTNADEPAATETAESAILALSATPTATESVTPTPDPLLDSSPSPLPTATQSAAPSATVPVATRAPTLTRAPTNTRLPTQTSAPSATPSPATPTLTATPEPPTSTPTPEVVACGVNPSPAFASLWESNQSLLGCPTDFAISIPTIAEQAFEGGHAFWRSDTDQMFVVFDRAGGTILSQGEWRTDSAWRWDGVTDAEGINLDPPAGRFEPVRGFGFVWRTFLGAQDGRLGWALEQERPFNSALVQRFQRGMIFRGSSATYILPDNGGFLRR